MVWGQRGGESVQDTRRDAPKSRMCMQHTAERIYFIHSFALFFALSIIDSDSAGCAAGS